MATAARAKPRGEVAAAACPRPRLQALGAPGPAARRAGARGGRGGAAMAGAGASAGAEAQAPEPALPAGEEYEVFSPKPLGVSWARGNDGGIYVKAITSNNADAQFTVGDKILQVSASFGPDVWDALNYGQVMYAIRTRSGEVYLKMEARGGDVSVFEINEDLSQFGKERAGGNYGIGTKELQQRNYIEKQEAERARNELFNDALDKFNDGDFEGALVDFENVKGMEPPNYVGDNFSRVTDVFRISCYNVACCHSSMGQVEAGVSALGEALRNGFDDYGKVRSDPNLAGLRESESFTELINKYDEPIINENAIKALKGLFGMGRK